ncbi:hypothetical protein [Streptomyces sp. NPDC017529]|uniref:hypothetical protein n=1 Tax=Streptomyces sp. NPDC017529 TaxID=3365000 RepID=UPI00379B0984
MPATAPRTASLPRELPAGSARSLPMLDAVVEVLRAAGEHVHVVYAAHGDLFKVVPDEQAA